MTSMTFFAWLLAVVVAIPLAALALGILALLSLRAMSAWVCHRLSVRSRTTKPAVGQVWESRGDCFTITAVDDFVWYRTPGAINCVPVFEWSDHVRKNHLGLVRSPDDV